MGNKTRKSPGRLCRAFLLNLSGLGILLFCLYPRVSYPALAGVPYEERNSQPVILRNPPEKTVRASGGKIVTRYIQAADVLAREAVSDWLLRCPLEFE